MQYGVDSNAVQNFNNNAPVVARESFCVGSKNVTVETYWDFYRTHNARVLIDGVCRDMQWNGGDLEYPDWNVPKGFPYPKGLAQYKLRKRIGELAYRLWLTQEDE